MLIMITVEKYIRVVRGMRRRVEVVLVVVVVVLVVILRIFQLIVYLGGISDMAGLDPEEPDYDGNMVEWRDWFVADLNNFMDNTGRSSSDKINVKRRKKKKDK